MEMGSPLGDENVLELEGVVVVQLGECAKCY